MCSSRPTSELEFDFAGYAQRHFERLERTVDDPSFRRALGEDEDASTCGGGGRRRRRLLDPLLARAARLGRRRPRRARRAHLGLDVPLRGARRPASQLALADPDDDELRRALSRARRRGRARDRLARGRLAAARLVGGEDGGDRSPGRAGRRRSGCHSSWSRRGKRRRCSRRCRPRACSGPPISRPTATSTLAADVRARRGRAAARSQIETQHALLRSASETAASRGVVTDKGAIETEIVVNAGGMFAQELGALAGVNVPIVPMAHEYLDHAAERALARPADDARSLAARLLPTRVGRPDHGRLRARPCCRGRSTGSRPISTASCWRRTGRASSRCSRTRSGGCRRSRSWRSSS